MPGRYVGGGGYRTHVFALLIFTCFSVALTWPLAWKMRDTIVSWGDPVFQAWTMAWNWHALTNSPGDLFDANVFYPWRNVLAYSDHLIGQTLLVWPVYALTDNILLADNLAFFMALILSAMAMYLLVVDITGNRLAGISGRSRLCLRAAMRMAHVEHLHMLSAQWLPLALLCLRRMTLTTGRGTSLVLGGRAHWRVFLCPGTLRRLLPVFHDRDAARRGRGLSGLSRGIVRRDGQLVLCDQHGGRRLRCWRACYSSRPLWPYQQVHLDLGVEREESRGQPSGVRPRVTTIWLRRLRTIFGDRAARRAASPHRTGSLPWSRSSSTFALVGLCQ